MPKVPGLEKALQDSSAGGKLGGGGSGGDGAGAENEKQREEARAKKNVNRSLQRLKEQIKAEKLRKRLEVRSVDRPETLSVQNQLSTPLLQPRLIFVRSEKKTLFLPIPAEETLRG